MGKKVLILGWDCASPDLLFNKFIEDLPNVKKLISDGYSSKLKSCIPPITIPAWQVMLTGKDPGELGLYGFRHRVDNSYDDFSIATSNSVKSPRIWEIIAESGHKSILSGIPPSFPVNPVNGILIPCFITPDADREYAYPPEIKQEVEDLIGDYPFDVVFRTENKQKLKEDVFDMTEKHYRIFEHLIKTKPWSFAMHVEIGLDRVQHGFWRYFDKNHHLHEPDSPFKDVIRDYYKLLDKWLGRIMDIIDEDTLLIIASDHGAKAMKGAFCVNQWLEKEGYLKYKKKPETITSVQKADINWKKTRAWGWGGYYSRIFFNVKGREKHGKIKEKDIQKELVKIKKKILSVQGPQGESWDTKVFTPAEVFQDPKGELSELMVFWDDMSWRAAGTVGHDSIYIEENDTGPDDGVHDWYGAFMAWNRREKPDIAYKDLKINNVFDIVMSYFRGAD